VRVLVVEDDADVQSVLIRALERDGHAVAAANTLAEARDGASDGPELIVLDVGLPDGSGLTLCRELRHEGVPTPMLILTARSDVASRVEGLDAGADDYLVKPFAVAELRARVRALGRRGPIARAFVHEVDDVVLDISGRRATKAGQVVPVTAREWAILEVLAMRAGRVVARSELLDSVWGEVDAAAAKSLEVLVARLRKKLGARVITTLRGEGYTLAVAARNVS
jgi:DNA-binding response OmpR family regulator